MADIASILRDGQNVDMPALRRHLAQSDAVLATGTIAALVGTRVYGTQAALYADLVPAANLYALVTFDADPDNNGLYVKSGSTGTGSWTGPSDLFASAAVSAVQPFVDEVAAAMAGGGVGDVHTKTTNASGTGFAWAGRDELSDQPVLPSDLTDPSEYQILGAFSSPDTRFSSAVVGDEVRITSALAAAFPVGVATGDRLAPGKVFRVQGRISAGATGLEGIYLGFSPNVPALGGGVVAHPVGSKLITVRQNGSVVLYDETTTDGTALGVTPASEFTSEPAELIFEATSATAGIIQVVVNGTPQVKVPVTGLPASGYLVGGIRIGGATTVGFISAIESYGRSLDVPARIHINPNVGAVGGIGTEANPFETIDEAVASYERDTARREIDLVLKGGIIRGQLKFDATRWRKIGIRGAQGQKPIILGSVAITTSGWTQIGSSDVWHRALPAYRDNNNTYGGLIDVTSGVSETFGRTGSYTVQGRRLMSRLAANVAYNHASFVAGSYSVHTTGTYAGKVLVRCWGNADPNDRDWEWAVNDSCISVQSSDDAAGWNGCIVEISDIETLYSFAFNYHLRNVRFRLANLYAGGACVGYGYELNHSSGEAFGATAEGCGFDGWHWSGDGTAPEKQTMSTLFDCWAKGMANIPQGFGDGFSNHRSIEHAIAFHGGGAIAVGKDGVSSSGACDLFDFYAADCADSGVKLYADADIAAATLRMFGGHLKGNLKGLTCDCGSADAVARTVAAHRVLMDTNATYNLQSFASGTGSTATINAYDCRTLGATPSSGHRSGTVNVLTSAALT